MYFYKIWKYFQGLVQVQFSLLKIAIKIILK